MGNQDPDRQHHEEDHPSDMDDLQEFRARPALHDAMELITTFTTTPKSVMQSYRACHRAAYILRWVVTVGALVLGVVERDVGLVVAAVVLFALVEWSVRRQLKPYLSGPRTVTVTITDDEYRTQGPDRATGRTWSVFTKVHRVGDFWVLRISQAEALGLPAAALTDEQTAEFVALMRSKALLKE